MLQKRRERCRKAELFLVLAALAAFPVLVMSVQERHEGSRIGLPIDWSTRHILFTNGASPEVAAAAARDPRSWINWAYRSKLQFRPIGVPLFDSTTKRKKHERIDWAISLGPTGGMPIGETPAKFTFNTNGPYSCANDFAVFTINATPGANQANIVAFNNLYTGTASSSCPFGPQKPPTTDYTQATFMWSYWVGNGPVALSPVLSLNGSKVGFVESSTTNAMFDVLTWVAGQGTSATAPATPGTGGSSVVRLDYTNVAVPGCAANPAGDNDSSAYVDYGTDAVYVGASNGNLYRITGVFNGVPTVQYCVVVNAGASLTSPVYNSVTNQVFVSDGFTVYSFTPGATGFTPSGSIAVAGNGSAQPIILSPIVDSTNGFVYVFSATNVANNKTVVSQMNLALTSQVQAAIGPAATANQEFVLDGDFDNQYFTNGPKTGAGTLYACGTQATNHNKPSLYALSFSAPNGLMNAAPAMSDNRHISTAANPISTCSPLVEFFDGTTDRLFVGVGNFGGTTGSNLVSEWDINTRIPTNATLPNATATNAWGGTSAFSIDNVVTDYQTGSIYFGTLQGAPGGNNNPCGTGNFCAIKLTQSGLQ